jgi:hypothetical protein
MHMPDYTLIANWSVPRVRFCFAPVVVDSKSVDRIIFDSPRCFHLRGVS